MPDMRRSPNRHVSRVLVVAMVAIGALAGCAADSRKKPVLAYGANEFRRALELRVPEIPATLARAPHEIDELTIERARRHVMAAPRGPDRVQALVDFLSMPRPEGLGLAYDWSASGTAEVTIERGRGNCVALASVLVGLGRGLGWPIYYAEARTRKPETQQFQEVVALSDHMAVLVVAKTVQMIIDFTGLVEDIYEIRLIDDLTAWAHILNNLTAQSLMNADRVSDEATWQRAVAGFDLVTRIDPTLGRAWNNLGIALTRLQRFDEAREAYRRAVELDTAFGSAERNLTIMETRALGDAAILETPRPE